MNTLTKTLNSSPAKGNSTLVSLMQRFVALCSRIPHWPIAFLARFSIAAVFWKSGETKIQGFAIDLINGDVMLGWPSLSDSALALFRDEYRLPFVAPEIAAPMAAFAEHFFPILLLFGLATRLSALALLGMTLTIQLFVYPDAYPTHGTWAAVLLLLLVQGPGKLSLDHWISRRFSSSGEPGPKPV
jgi:putative oxidoreductase